MSFVSFALLCSGILAVAVTATEILKRLAKGPNYYFETSPSFTEANQVRISGLHITRVLIVCVFFLFKGTSVADDVILDSLTAIRYKYGLYVTSFWANRYYDALLRSACGDSAVADRLAFSTLGTNRETMVLFDALDRGLLYRLQAYVELRMPRILSALLRSFPGLVAWLTLLVVAKVALYYADLAKDVFLVAQLKSKLLGDAFGLSYDAVRNNLYPLTILALMAASLAATEVLNFLTIVLFVNSGSALRKMLLCLSTPLLVGFGVYSAAKRALKVKVLCNGSRDRDRLHESLRSIRYAGYEEDRLHSLLLANENLLEHFVQSALLAVVLLAEESPTRAVQTAGNILVDGSGYAAVALSACSLVRGHVAYIAALKRGHLSNLGQAILALYFLASIATRMWAIVVCLTPLLGLLGSLDFARLATIPSSKFAVRDDDGTVVGFAGSRGDWEEPFHISGLSELFPGRLAASSYSGVAAAVLASHVAAALALHGRFFCRLGRWQLLYTFVCPPLFVDWEEIYRTAFSETVSECWRKSRTVHAAFVALIAWQNLVMCVPLAIYRGILWRRADQMLEGGFLLLPEEENSISFINWLLAGSVVLFAVFSPLSQMFFSVVYFKHGHPWSRILRREANVGMLQLELPRLF